MRPLNLDELRTFLAIQETGTFRAAAARVNLSASAVSLQISNLEAVLGCRLFHRNARGVALTEGGERLLPKAREFVNGGAKTGHGAAQKQATFLRA